MVGFGLRVLCGSEDGGLSGDYTRKPGVKDNQPRFSVEGSLLRASLRALHCGV